MRILISIIAAATIFLAMPTKSQAAGPSPWMVEQLCLDAIELGQTFIYWDEEIIECISIEGTAPSEGLPISCPISCEPYGYPFPGCNCSDDSGNDPDFGDPGPPPTPLTPCRQCNADYASCSADKTAFTSKCHKFVEEHASEQCVVHNVGIDGQMPPRTEKCLGCVDWVCEFEDDFVFSGKASLCDKDGNLGLMGAIKLCGIGLQHDSPLCTDTTISDCEEGWLDGRPQLTVATELSLEINVGIFTGGASRKVEVTFSSRKGLRSVCNALSTTAGFDCLGDQDACRKEHSCPSSSLPRASLPGAPRELEQLVVAGSALALVSERRSSTTDLEFENQTAAVGRWREFENSAALPPDTIQILRRAAYAAQRRTAAVTRVSFQSAKQRLRDRGAMLDIGRQVRSLEVLQGLPKASQPQFIHNDFLMIDGMLFSVAAEILTDEDYQSFRRLFPSWAHPFGLIEMFELPPLGRTIR